MPPAATTTEEARPSLAESFNAAMEELKPTETTETTTEEPTTETTETEPAKEEEPVAEPDKPTDEEGILSQAEFDALQTTHAKEPAKVLAALNKAFTQKTQALSAERKTYEKVQPYGDLIEAYEADAEGTITALARERGYKLVKDEAPAAEAAKPVVDEALGEFRKALGPDYEYLADALSPALSALVQRVAADTVKGAVEPLKAETQAIITKQAQEQTTKIFADFEKKHPDYKQHEKAMHALSQQVQPHGMDELAYLEHLYTAVTMDQTIGERVKAALAKVNKAAIESDGTRAATVTESQVKKDFPAKPTLREAAAAALEGVRFE
jgi:hypothetical protein